MKLVTSTFSINGFVPQNFKNLVLHCYFVTTYSPLADTFNSPLASLGGQNMIWVLVTSGCVLSKRV